MLRVHRQSVAALLLCRALLYSVQIQGLFKVFEPEMARTVAIETLSRAPNKKILQIAIKSIRCKSMVRNDLRKHI